MHVDFLNLYNSKIIGVGHFVPENIVTNQDLTRLMDTTDSWIQERTGVKERRWARPKTGNTTSEMGVKAAKIAIKNSGLKKNNIDFIIFATLSPDYYFPGPGVLVQQMLGLDTIGALDVRNQCSGFIYAISVADQYIKTGKFKNILVIGSEYQSYGVDKSTRGRTISVIFGDGAGAVVLTREKNNDKGVLSTHLHSEGKYAKELSCLAPGFGTRWVNDIIKDNDPNDESYLPYMNGQLVFKNAVLRFQEVIKEGLDFNNLSNDDIDLFIPHQANLRISQFIQKRLGLSDDKVYNNITRYGNTTAASIPIALSEAVSKKKLKSNDLLVLAAFGAGFTWGSAIIRW